MRRLLLFSILLMSILLFSVSSHTTVPRLINYQGIITDIDGKAITDTVDITFTIYDGDGPGAQALWNEEHLDVGVIEGLFNVLLGGIDVIPDSLFASSERWMGIQVENDPEMDPRIRITSVPWAMRAAVAETALVVGDVIAHSHYSLDAQGAGPDSVVYVDSSGDVKVRGGVAIGTTYGIAASSGGSGISMPENTAGGKTKQGLRPQLVASAEEPKQLTPPPDGMIIEGNVGIGTDNPAEKLDVAGTIRAEGLDLPSGAVFRYILTSDSAGAGSWQPNIGSRVPVVVYADLMPGSDAGEMIRAAIDSLPAEGGVVDARGLGGEQSITQNLFDGIDRNVTLLLGVGTYEVSIPQVYYQTQSHTSLYIVGQGSGTVLKPTIPMTMISVNKVVTGGGATMFRIMDLYFDLNQTNSTAIETSYGYTRFTIDRILIRNNGSGSTAPLIKAISPGTTMRDIVIAGKSYSAYGIEIWGESCTVDNSMISGCHSGIYIAVGFPTLITNSVFGHNAHHGILVDYKSVTTTIIEGNIFEGNDEGAIKIVGNASQFPARATTIRDNYMTGIGSPESYGIYLEKVQGITIEANRFRSYFPGTNCSPIAFGDNVSEVTLVGNSVHQMDVQMSGYENVSLPVNDVTATQSTNSGGFGNGLTVTGAVNIDNLIRLQPSNAPPDPSEGDIYMDTSTHKLMVFDGSVWRACW